MAIKRSTRRPTIGRAKTPMNRRPITAGTSITASATKRGVSSKEQQYRQAVMASYRALTPAQKVFVDRIRANCRTSATRTNGAVMAATNTSNIAARPEFLDLLPFFVQNLFALEVCGSVAMKSRQQFIPYFKYVAENTKGETNAGDILSSPMVNRQGIDPNFTGRVVKNEVVESATGTFQTGTLAYLPVLPGSVTVQTNLAGVTTSYTDDGAGSLLDGTGSVVGGIEYSTGTIELTTAATLADGDTVKATYQYDNETVGPNADGKYGAQMGKGYLVLDEFDMKAEAHQLANYWSIYSAFVAQQEYGANIADLAKEAAFAELTAEINTQVFAEIRKAAVARPQYNWDASPVLTGSVMPSDYLNMFKLKLQQAAAGIYQATQLARPNRLIIGTNTASYISMIDGFNSAGTSDSVGPYKLGSLDQFEIFVEPKYNPNEWVMCCKSDDIRRNSALFGEYMPMMETAPITTADGTVQQGYATMYGMKVVNPATTAAGKITGVF